MPKASSPKSLRKDVAELGGEINRKQKELEELSRSNDNFPTIVKELCDLGVSIFKLKHAKPALQEEERYSSYIKKYGRVVTKYIMRIDVLIDKYVIEYLTPYISNWIEFLKISRENRQLAEDILPNLESKYVYSASECEEFVLKIRSALNTAERSIKKYEANLSKSNGNLNYIINWSTQTSDDTIVIFAKSLIVGLISLLSFFLFNMLSTFAVMLVSLFILGRSIFNINTDSPINIMISTVLKVDDLFMPAIAVGKKLDNLPTLRGNLLESANIIRKMGDRSFLKDLREMLRKGNDDFKAIKQKYSELKPGLLECIDSLNSKAEFFKEQDLNRTNEVVSSLDSITALENFKFRAVYMPLVETVSAFDRYRKSKLVMLLSSCEFECSQRNQEFNSLREIYNIFVRSDFYRTCNRAESIQTRDEAISYIEKLKSQSVSESGKLKIDISKSLIGGEYPGEEKIKFAQNIFSAVNLLLKYIEQVVLLNFAAEREKVKDLAAHIVKSDTSIADNIPKEHVALYRAIKKGLSVSSFSVSEIVVFISDIEKVLISQNHSMLALVNRDSFQLNNSKEGERDSDVQILDEVQYEICKNEQSIETFLNELQGLGGGNKVIRISSLNGFITSLGGSMEQQTKASSHYNVKLPPLTNSNNARMAAHTVCFPHGENQQYGERTIREFKKFISEAGIPCCALREVLSSKDEIMENTAIRERNKLNH